MPFELFAKLGLDQKGFASGLTQARGKVAQFAGSVRGQIAAAFGTAAITAHLRSIVSTIGRIKDLSEQYNASTDEVQKLDHALKQSGLSFEDLGGALRKVGDAREKAVEGNESLRETFAKYGLTLSDLNNPQVRHIDVLQRIAEATSGMALSQREANEMSQLLGDRSTRLFAALSNLKNLEGLKIFEQKDIDRIDEAAKKLAELNRQLMIFTAENITAAEGLEWRDIMAAGAENAFPGLSVNTSETPGADSGPLTPGDIQKGLADMQKRLAAQANAATATLYGTGSKEQDIDRLDKIEKRERETRLRAMSEDDRRAELQRERRALEADMSQRGFGTMADRERMSELDAEMFSSGRGRTSQINRGGDDRVVDPLARIGGFSIGTPDHPRIGGGGMGGTQDPVRLQERMANGIDKLVLQGERIAHPNSDWEE
jgi:hypothetical protein